MVVVVESGTNMHAVIISERKMLTQPEHISAKSGVSQIASQYPSPPPWLNVKQAPQLTFTLIVLSKQVNASGALPFAQMVTAVMLVLAIESASSMEQTGPPAGALRAIAIPRLIALHGRDELATSKLSHVLVIKSLTSQSSASAQVSLMLLRQVDPQTAPVVLERQAIPS